MFTFYYANTVNHSESKNLWHHQVIRALPVGQSFFEDVHLDFVSSYPLASELASRLNK